MYFTDRVDGYIYSMYTCTVAYPCALHNNTCAYYVMNIPTW